VQQELDYGKSTQIMTVGLETVVSYFPEETTQRSNFDYLAPITPDDMKGPDETRRLHDACAAEIMAEMVAKRALKSSGLAPSDINLLVTQNIGGRYIMPGLGTFLHDALGLPEKVPAWNLQTSCASFVDGCELGRNMVLAGNYRRVLLVTVTALNTGGWGVDQSTAFAAAAGDGAGAAIISDRNTRFEILSYSNRTLGEIYNEMKVDFCSTENPELMVGRPASNVVSGLHVTESFFDWAQTRGGKAFARDAIADAMKEARLTLSDLDLIVPHQAHKFMMDIWIEGLEEAGVPADKWRDTWNKYGNIGAVDVAATLPELVENGDIPRDAVIAFFAPGAGGHTPTMIVKYLG
jgi:3-oxoacyl-[acyl-carrier-protein] synthase-3